MSTNFLLILEGGHIGDNVCAEENVMKALRLVGYLLLIARLMVPIIIIIMGTLDLYKSVTGGSSESMIKQGKSLLIKVMIGVLIFVFPSFLNWLVLALTSNDNGNAQCVTCVLEPTKCEITGGTTTEEETTEEE